MFHNSPIHIHRIHKPNARGARKQRPTANHTLQHSKVALVALINADMHDYTDDRDTSDGQLISA